MKGRLISFAAGFAAATVFAGSSLTALAAEGALTIRAVMRRCIFLMALILSGLLLMGIMKSAILIRQRVGCEM